MSVLGSSSVPSFITTDFTSSPKVISVNSSTNSDSIGSPFTLVVKGTSNGVSGYLNVPLTVISKNTAPPSFT